MAKTINIRYVDRRPIYFPRLHFYPGGITLPNDTNELKVTDKEWKFLKLEKNGNNLCYEEIKKPKNVPITSEEVTDGSR